MPVKVSIVIPVYNSENSLEQCLLSIIEQTFKEWECILVDDGSTDRSGEICDNFARKDSRIKVLHKDNGGVSNSRNLGIDYSEGEWIMFIDSDDYIEVTALDEVIDHIKGEEVDLVVFGIKDVFPYKQRSISPDYSGSDSCKTIGEELLFADKKRMLQGPVNKLFRRSLISFDVRFDEAICYGEDTKFTFTYLLKCNKLSFLWKDLYHYVHREKGSLTTKKYPYDFWKRTAMMLFEIKKPIYKKFGIADDNYLYYIYFSHYLKGVLSLYENENIHSSDKKNAIGEFIKDPINIKYSPITRNHKIIKVCFCMPIVLDFLLSMYCKRLKFL